MPRRKNTTLSFLIFSDFFASRPTYPPCMPRGTVDSGCPRRPDLTRPSLAPDAGPTARHAGRGRGAARARRRRRARLPLLRPAEAASGAARGRPPCASTSTVRAEPGLPKHLRDQEKTLQRCPQHDTPELRCPGVPRSRSRILGSEITSRWNLGDEIASQRNLSYRACRYAHCDVGRARVHCESPRMTRMAAIAVQKTAAVKQCLFWQFFARLWEILYMIPTRFGSFCL